MVVGLGMITFKIHDCRSLKTKRSIVKTIVNGLMKNFNASVAEVGSNDVYDTAEIGFAMVGNDRSLLNSKIDKAFNLAAEMGIAEVMDTQMEIFNI